MSRRWAKYFDSETISKLACIGFKPSGLVEGNLVGNHRSPFHGFAIEFAGHRGYVPGDDIKHLDWKAYYKTGRYLLKQYEQETNFVAHVVVDVSASMKFEYKHGSRMDYSAFVATALAQVILGQSDSVGVHFFEDRIVEEISVSSSMEVVAKISAFYEERSFKGASSVGNVLDLLAEKMGRRRVIFVISDLFGDTEKTFDGIKKLLDRKHEIVLLQIIDPLEISFDIPGKVQFIGMETSEKMVLKGIDIRESYEELFGEFLADIRQRSLALGVDHILCDMSKPFGFHLAEYLSERTHK